MSGNFLKTKMTNLGFLIFLFFFCAICMSVGGSNAVTFDPSSLSVSEDETFNVSIYCTPSQPIKAFELTLSFDASLLQANSVTEGNIFGGYDTFFSSGLIDNTEGTIVNVYDLIIGQGNVSGAGSLVTISFTSQDESGSCTLDFDGVGITDEFGFFKECG